jgi:hypothetical protein
MFSQKPLDGVSVEFLFRKNLPDAILIFGRHFGFFSNLLFFPKNMSIFFIKIILQNGKSLFVDFCQIYENKKSKIRHLGLCRYFERFSKTLFYKMLVLLSTTKRERFFLKNMYFWISEAKKIDFRPTLMSPPSWIFLSKFQRNRVQKPKICKKCIINSARNDNWHYTSVKSPETWK